MTTLGDRAGEIVAQGQRQSRELAAIHPVSSSTRASVARDARRSHRSVEGDEKLCVERVETPILYKRVLLFSPIRSRPVWGGGGGGSSPATSTTRIMSSTWASVVPAGKVPKDTTPTTSTASLPVLARRFRADPHEVGRIEGIGPDLWKLGAATTRASVGREPVTSEDCGSDCGSGVSNWARTPTGF